MAFDFPVSSSRIARLRTGSVAVLEEAAIVRVEGKGALDCLQGLLTNDLAGPGQDALVFGAFLTSKGMIVVDPWVLREAERFTLVMDLDARGTVHQLLAKVLPPRLARTTDLSDQWSALRLLGGVPGERLLRALGGTLPAPGHLIRLEADPEALLATGTSGSAFRHLLVGPREALLRISARAGAAGAAAGDSADLAAARVLAGWPTLGREIDDKTLPQEAGFDRLGGVSYVKGCYTGQETVARIHFRGHVNRQLQGVVLEGGDPPGDRTLLQDGKPVGTIRTALLLEDRVLGLAMVRREVEPGALLATTEGGRTARVTRLPFEAPELPG